MTELSGEQTVGSWREEGAIVTVLPLCFAPLGGSLRSEYC